LSSRTEIKKEDLETGLTWRSLLANFLAIMFFIPVSTYLFLLTGQTVGNVAVFSISLIFVELASLSYAKLRKQETFMVYYGAGWGGVTAAIFLPLLYRRYFMESPFGWSAKINGKYLAELVPAWLAPPLESPAYIMRTFFHSDFLVPALIIIGNSILTLIANLALNMMIARLALEVEKYEFPFAEVELSLIEFLSEKPPDRTRLFLFAMIPGIVFSFLAYLAPLFLGFQVIPLPFLDLTWLIQDYLPGAALGIATPLSAYFGSFIIPFNAAICVLITASVLRIFLNSLFITTFPNLFPEWVEEYFPGMGLIAVQTRSAVRVWFPLTFGFSLGACIFMIYKSRKGIKSLIRALISAKEEEKDDLLGFPSNIRLFALFLGCSGASIVLFHYLIPEVPLWIVIFTSIGYSFLMALVVAATQGEVGMSVVPTDIWSAMIYLSPYSGYAGFVFTPSITGQSAGTFPQRVKVALGTRCKPTDLPKLQIIAWTLTWALSFVVLSVFWSIAPIPSAAYPATVYLFPQNAQTVTMLVTRQMKFSPEYIFTAIGSVIAISFIGELLLRFGIPFSHTGFFLGLFSLPAGAVPIIIGSAISNYVMPRFFGGKRNWMRIRGTIIAGEMMGEGIILIFLLSMSLLSKASWMWPW